MSVLTYVALLMTSLMTSHVICNPPVITVTVTAENDQRESSETPLVQLKFS